jgi:peptidoglycan/xylan/chitin deacetylase (PgdA/CDA1 family)
MAGLGITSLKWRWLPRGLYILNYHRVGDPAATPYDRDIFSCTTARFREHILLLKDRFDLIGLDRLRHGLAHGFPRGKPPAMVTFDDGYRDNYLNAFPVLRELDVPAVFFLPTAFIGTGVPPWWDEVAWTLRQSLRPCIQLGGDVVPLAQPALERAILRALDWIKTDHRPLPEKLAELRAAAGVDFAATAPGLDLFMSWSEAREMRAAGMDIGSHTHTHPILAHLTEQAQFEELGTSKELLEANLGAPVDSIAYPVGRPFAYDARTLAAARMAGYRLGFNFTHKVGPLCAADPLDICRLAVEDFEPRPTLRSIIAFPSLV